MPKIAYATGKKKKRFGETATAIIHAANMIIEEYADQGFDLTLRQLYYQFVARGFIPNSDAEYRRLGQVMNRARLAGLVDWSAIVDRTRNLRSAAHWEGPSELLHAAMQQYRIDRWAGQEWRVEVWIEKDALLGVIEDVCDQLDVPYFSCRGYVSQSEMWNSAERILERIRGPYRMPPRTQHELDVTRAHLTPAKSQGTIILHLGDHDPSGIDMTRDIQDRLSMFVMKESENFKHMVYVDRIALTREQVEQYDPPPNPAKVTDSRAGKYLAEHGDESWELDALEPQVMANLIRKHVAEHRDDGLWEEALAREEAGRAQMREFYESAKASERPPEEPPPPKKSKKKKATKKKATKKKASKKKATKKKASKKKATKKRK